MPKTTPPPARPATQRPKAKPATATPAGAEPRTIPAPIKLSAGDAKLMAAVLMEMLKR
ncbi:hypothetical protein HW932_15285 [Allochromatium humboldtianum]|uniref:Uncharacterized protein n=1 Tax=Allochromatium humboldtianum TaxID=504901 RepID=A0A850REH1_9GAMM|nr:hypothetical protein [Allochromatium humboldtianum]NVZ10626.1 hypothetical protein [Allochromatium humboldtianum]